MFQLYCAMDGHGLVQQFSGSLVDLMAYTLRHAGEYVIANARTNKAILYIVSHGGQQRIEVLR